MSPQLTKRQILTLMASRLKALIQVAGTVGDDRMRLVAHHLTAAANLLIDIGETEREARR
jgi:hydrogenase-4 membrane subunit HyfE